MLNIENMNAGYNGKSIISNISLSIKPGEFTAILGLNGAGKTTLLKTISGLLKPIDGNVFLNGENILLLNEKERAKHISFMPQSHSVVYDIKVIDLVLMGVTPYLSFFQSPNSEDRKKAYEILETIAMEQYSEKNFLHLSEGQKQLIIMARSLMQNSEIMLFDEPVSALDFINKHLVLSNIKKILEKQNKIGVITLHDPNLALNYCDKIMIIDEGKLYVEFLTKDISENLLMDIFSKMYGEIGVVRHKDKFVIVR
ncbi:MAG: ABC transporter ATP-binding protein [Tissierellia bacterium]|nr:ABC transporter ATP-binding protein [Tissierellia bacterium]